MAKSMCMVKFLIKSVYGCDIIQGLTIFSCYVAIANENEMDFYFALNKDSLLGGLIYCCPDPDGKSSRLKLIKLGLWGGLPPKINYTHDSSLDLIL